jgi:hypothetical protein
MINVDLRDGNLHAMELIQVENEVDEVFQLLVAAFWRQLRETFKQSGVDMYMNPSLFPLCPDALFKDPVQTVPKGRYGFLGDCHLFAKDGLRKVISRQANQPN